MSDIHEITRPYPGLRPFESWEGEIFFGREEHTNRLLDILKERQFLAVIGPSGSGKSSLVRAGLLPILPLGSLGTGSDWRVALMRPGNRPIRSLTHALLERSTLGIELVGEEHIPLDDRDMTSDVALIEADLRRGPLGLIDIVQDARTRQTGQDAFNLLVLVDQFEELFTYADAGGRQADEAEAFVNLLLAPQTVPDAQIYVVLTMRTDFLGNCVRFLELPDAINRAQYLTPRLTREQIERAITNPAYIFDGNVEPTLVTELINSVSNDPDQLPILQHALSRMWDEASQRQSESPCIAWNDFSAVGGITNALSLHADEILASLSPRSQIEPPLCPEQLAAVDLFRAITEQRSAEAGGQAVRRPQSLVRIAQWSGRKWLDFKSVIDAYSREGINFLHINTALNEDTIVDISHEALIRQWQRLRDWVSQEARLAGEYQRFRSRAEAFKNGSGALLTGADLARALEWRNGTFSKGPDNEVWQPNANWADRYRKNQDVPSNTEFNEVLKFIDDSHAVVLKQKRRARIVKRALITLTVLSVLATIGAFVFAYQSYHNEIKVEAVLLWTPLDFSSPIINVTEKQASGLRKLELANDFQKQAFFDQLMMDQALAERFINNPEAIMTGMVGISPTRKNELLHRLDVAPDQDSNIFDLVRFLILSELDAKISIDDTLSAIAGIKYNKYLTSKDNKYLTSRKKLGQRINTLIGKMPETDLETLSNRILASFNDPTIAYEFDLRVEVLASIINRIPQENLDKIANQLIAVIKIADSPLQLATLKQSLALVAEKMQDKQQIGALAGQLFTAINASLNQGQIEAFGKSLEKLAPKISDILAQELAEQLVNLIKDPRNSYSFKTLGQSLASVAATMPEQDPLAAKLAYQLFTAMIKSMVPEQFDALGQGLAAIAAKIPTSESKKLTIQLINAIKDSSQFKFIGQEFQEKDIDRFRMLGQDLAAIIKMTPDEQAETLAEMLFSAIKMPLDSGQLYALGLGLKEVTAKLTQTQADTFAKQLFTAMKNVDATDAQFSAFGEGVAGIAKKMSAPQAYALAEEFISIIKSQEKEQNFIRFDALRKGIAGLAAQVSEAQASALTEQLIDEIKASKYPMQTMALESGVEKAAANIPVPQIVKESTFIISLFKDTNDTPQLIALVKALESMVKKLPEKQLNNDPKMQQGRSKIKTSGKGLKAVTAMVQETQVEALTGQLIDAINESKDPDKEDALGQGLAAACKKTTPLWTNALADKLVTAMMKSSTTPSQFEALRQGLSAVIEKLPEPRQILARQLVEIIRQTQNPTQRQVLGQIFSVITGELIPDDGTLAQWFELLKNPLTPRNILAAAILQRLSDAPKENQGVWDLIEWTKLHYPDVDLEAN